MSYTERVQNMFHTGGDYYFFEAFTKYPVMLSDNSFALSVHSLPDKAVVFDPLYGVWLNRYCGWLYCPKISQCNGIGGKVGQFSGFSIFNGYSLPDLRSSPVSMGAKFYNWCDAYSWHTNCKCAHYKAQVQAVERDTHHRQ